MPETNATPRTTSINYCARCCGEHPGVVLHEFTRAVLDGPELVATHWAMCPALQEPILVLITETPSTDAQN
jgi:hypothetical protein